MGTEGPEDGAQPEAEGNDLFAQIMGDPDTVDTSNLPEDKAEDEVVEEKAETTPDDPYKTRYENAEKLIGRQGQEVGALRKQVEELMAKLSGKTDSSEKDGKFLDRFVADPQEALKAELDRREAQRQAEEGKKQESVRQNLSILYDKVPDFDNLKQTILDLAKEDGVENPTMEMLEWTMKNEAPYAIQFAKRAIERQKYLAIEGKGKRTLDNLAKGTRSTPVVTGKSGQSSSKDKFTETDINNMSDAEIKAALAKRGYRR